MKCKECNGEYEELDMIGDTCYLCDERLTRWWWGDRTVSPQEQAEFEVDCMTLCNMFSGMDYDNAKKSAIAEYKEGKDFKNDGR